MKRKIEICVISDVHIGSYGCHATELDNYLKSIDPKILILNGDIFDGWNFNKNYIKSEHIKLIRTFLKMLKDNTKIYYISGNHDDFMRNFDEISLLNLHRLDKLVMEIDGKSYWFFHGDVFDISMQGKIGKIVSRFGGQAYDLIIFLNKLINKFLISIGKKPYSLSKKIKDSVKKAVIYVNDFETMSCEHAIKQGFDYVVNGHIHQPTIREYSSKSGSVVYMNSGDYVENLSSLEYVDGKWIIFYYRDNFKI